MNKFRGLIYIIIIVLVLNILPNVYAAIIYVPQDQKTIQAGINVAVDGDTVLVADGLYTGEGNVNIDFKGKQITVKSQNGPKSTIITCGKKANTRGFSFTNKETNASVLEGLTIKNGVHDKGGGIYCNNASPTIKNCIIELNSSGIYAKNSDIVILDTSIINNHGTGIYFISNIDELLVDREIPTVERRIIECTISRNAGSGIVSLETGGTIIKDSTITQNQRRGIVATSFHFGTQITNCEISGNTGGGVECSEYSGVKLQDSIIKQNTGDIGGGIYGSPSGRIEVTNCIIAENIARRGGGIASTSKFDGPKITNCTITRNIAEERGGGVYAVLFGADLIMLNSIVWGNSSNGTHPEFFGTGPSITIRNSNIKDGREGMGVRPFARWFIYEDNIDKDPLFLDADSGDYRLKFNSPAKGMGADSLQHIIYSVSSVGKKLVSWGEIKRR